ncbi:DDE domain protein [Collimonas fungivorans]|uniref:DDE domain protein n=2 Tax=Collimonas fungivorans TaxID=158899 RepID=A0A127P636_9BURK|nr:DDE domain protein [Collimonas fungivorans]
MDKPAIDALNADREVPIVVRQIKALNNSVEQDHRVVKRVIRPMLGFRSFQAAENVSAGIELMRMIRKEQSTMAGADAMSFANQFYALAGPSRAV